MTKGTIGVLAATISGIVFGAVGFFTGRYFGVKKEKDRADSEIQSVKNAFGKEVKKIREKAAKQMNSRSALNQISNPNTELDIQAIRRGDKGNPRPPIGTPNFADYNDYTKFVKERYPSPSVTQQKGPVIPDTQNAYGPIITNEQGVKIYIISPNEYQDDGMDSKLLYSYTDGVIADEDNNKFEVANTSLGAENVNYILSKTAKDEPFNKYKDDPDTIYIRNEGENTDYEIRRTAKKYEDENSLTSTDYDGDDEPY